MSTRLLLVCLIGQGLRMVSKQRWLLHSHWGDFCRQQWYYCGHSVLHLWWGDFDASIAATGRAASDSAVTAAADRGSMC